MRSERMQRAVLALANGERALARSILRNLILENPRNQQAWLLMAEAVDSANRRSIAWNASCRSIHKTDNPE
jgi:Tfp pilus assembly protein PilF